MENLREQKGKVIAQTRQIMKLDDGFAVQSQASKKFYFVDSEGNCTCPDCSKNGASKCKHVFAVEYYLQKITTSKNGAVIETKRLTYPQAWHAYNLAQNNEVNLFDKLLKDLIAHIEEPTPKEGAGRPSLSLREQLFCSAKKVYSMLSSRRAKSLYNNAKEKGYLNDSPHANAVNKFFNRKDITPILQDLITLSSTPLKSVETKFAIDSTGFSTTKFYEYCQEKHGKSKRHQWVKLHAVCGVKTNVIVSCQITPSNVSDKTMFEPLVQNTKNNGFNVQELTADGGYSSRTVLETANNLGMQSFIPFNKNATGASQGSPLWSKMFHYFKFNQEEFSQHYHARSNIESTFGALKAKFGDSIKSKNWTSQQNELLAKILCYNIAVLIHELYEIGINPELIFGKTTKTTVN